MFNEMNSAVCSPPVPTPGLLSKHPFEPGPLHPGRGDEGIAWSRENRGASGLRACVEVGVVLGTPVKAHVQGSWSHWGGLPAPGASDCPGLRAGGSPSPLQGGGPSLCHQTGVVPRGSSRSLGTRRANQGGNVSRDLRLLERPGRVSPCGVGWVGLVFKQFSGASSARVPVNGIFPSQATLPG